MKDKNYICKILFKCLIIILSLEACSILVPFFYKGQAVSGVKAIISFGLLVMAIGLNLVINYNYEIRDSYHIEYRFALDSMNQKFFDIDNRLNSGIITEKQAEELKEEIHHEIRRYEQIIKYSDIIHYLDNAAILFVVCAIVIQSILLRKPIFFWAYYITLTCCLIEAGCYHIYSKEQLAESLYERLINLIHNSRNNEVKAGVKALYFKQFLSDFSVNRLDSKFRCSLRFGNLLKTQGDILLCPLGDGFKPANPLAHWVIEKEGTYLKKALRNLKETEYDKTEFAAYIPCKKLKYKGIIFVCVDFYSEKRTLINAKRIAEGFLLAKNQECSKLSCPVGYLYDKSHPETCKEIFSELDQVIRILDGEAKNIDYIIELVIKRNLHNYSMFSDYQKFMERIPNMEEQFNVPE